jgi:hypothetical protein
MNNDSDDLYKVYKSVYKPTREVAPKRVYNPLYDGRKDASAPLKFNRLYLIPIMCLMVWTYWQNDLKDKSVVERELSRAEKMQNNRDIFDERENKIGELGMLNDPHIYNQDGDTLPIPNPYRTDVVKSPTPIAADAPSERNERLRRKRPIASAVLNGIDTFSNKIVFAGSFVNRDNAEKVLTRLKTMGYSKAEIVMKEKLPYNVVVTRIDNQDIRAKSEVKSLQKRGIEVYAAEKNMEEIYRNPKK